MLSAGLVGAAHLGSPVGCNASLPEMDGGIEQNPAYGTVQPFDFHDLRHTVGTLALRQGVPLHTVSKMLGHSDPAMTLRRYAHVLEDMREDAARAMDELF
jgi:integrase